MKFDLKKRQIFKNWHQTNKQKSLYINGFFSQNKQILNNNSDIFLIHVSCEIMCLSYSK